MQQTYSTTAIILSNEKYRERDSRVLLYSRQKGLLSLVARGTISQKSKLSPFLDPLVQVKIMVTRGRVINYLSSVVTKNNFLNLKENYDAIQTANQAALIFKRHVREGEAESELYDLLNSFFSFLDTNQLDSDSCDLFHNFFLYKFLCQTGHQAELYHCVQTAKKVDPQNNFFDYENGGLVGKRSKNCLSISINSIKILRLANHSSFQTLKKINISSKEAKELSNIIKHYYTYHQNNI